MLQQISTQVVRIIARASGQLPSNLRAYFLLRRSENGNFGLAMDDPAIRGMIPSLNALVEDYGQSVTRDELLNADDIKTVWNVLRLVENKVQAGLDEVREQVIKILAEAALPTAIETNMVEAMNLLTSPPLNLTPEALENVRSKIVREVPRWSPGITLTPAEMAKVSIVQELTDLVASEITHPIAS